MLNSLAQDQYTISLLRQTFDLHATDARYCHQLLLQLLEIVRSSRFLEVRMASRKLDRVAIDFRRLQVGSVNVRYALLYIALTIPSIERQTM